MNYEEAMDTFGETLEKLFTFKCHRCGKVALHGVDTNGCIACEINTPAPVFEMLKRENTGKMTKFKIKKGKPEQGEGE